MSPPDSSLASLCLRGQSSVVPAFSRESRRQFETASYRHRPLRALAGRLLDEVEMRMILSDIGIYEPTSVFVWRP